ncbi:MAG: Lrp/AsnC family transcriptional regulator [Candidatus Abyssobacteria bacterium SURF_17]|jgi:DNA-binding Lrp family transcriptional regulator|uniref:siroheme decarboxylase n=1 Tax=Candidatus Abyssobacteria bacterium SURF_17 TaxID=2093361 RepID=A0A419F0Z5_9BACT|nr:MAG: Lrp/AsnC family transcriptional regulator [Candidatus Abyssubacteria bacterium SURF_17]
MKLDPLDHEIINALSGDISDSLRPYHDIASRLNISEDELLRRVRNYEKTGVLRRMGAMIAHRVAGVDANGMIVWDIPEEHIEDVGRKLASTQEVTHCYARRRHPDWPYNLYTMVHGRTRKTCERIAARLAQEVGIGNYKVVFSTREFKKTSPRYFVK